MAQLKSELFRDKLQTRTRGKSESLPELAQSIKKLTRQAYPSAQSSLTSVLGLHNPNHLFLPRSKTETNTRLNPRPLHIIEVSKRHVFSLVSLH
jgi:hypothetical protein